MLPTDFTCAAVDDDDDFEPMTVPRPRAISGVCLTEERKEREAAAEREDSARWSITDETSGAASGADPGHESGIYPIFDDGDAALQWMKQRRIVQQCTADIEASPDDPLGYILRARAKVELGTIREALDDCARALAIQPDYVAGYVALGREILFDTQAFADCATDCTRALRIDRTHVAAYQKRASARAALGDYQGAIHDYDEAILLRPHDAGMFRDRGEMKSRLGDLQAALQDLNVAGAMNPADEDTQFKRGLVKVMIAESARGPVDWGKAVTKALAAMATKTDDGRLA